MVVPMGSRWSDLAGALLQTAADWLRDVDDEVERRELEASSDLNVVRSVCPVCGAETPGFEKQLCPWCGHEGRPVVRPAEEV